jgi:hypothetical protein
MNRRESLQLLTLAGVCALLSEVTRARSIPRTVIYDGRYPEALALAADAERAFDCRSDAAILWYSHLLSVRATGPMIQGATLPADAMVLADCARREGSHFEYVGAPRGDRPLVEWVIRRGASVDRLKT